MSTAELIQVPRYRLKTVDDIKARSGYSELSCSDCHTPGFKRVEVLGKAIEANLNKFQQSFSDITKELPKETKELLAKNYALQVSLKGLGNSLYSKATELETNKTIPNAYTLVKDTLNRKSNFSLSEIEGLNNKLAKNFDSLQEIAKNVHNNLMIAEKEVLKAKTMESLKNLGYNVAKIQKTNEILIRGEKNDISVAVTINKDSEIAVDMAGFEGHKCQKELKNIHSELNKLGIDILLKEESYHGKKEGGVLSQKIQSEFDILFPKNKTKSNKVIQVNKLRSLQNLKNKLKLRR